MDFIKRLFLYGVRLYTFIEQKFMGNKQNSDKIRYIYFSDENDQIELINNDNDNVPIYNDGRLEIQYYDKSEELYRKIIINGTNDTLVIRHLADIVSYEGSVNGNEIMMLLPLCTIKNIIKDDNSNPPISILESVLYNDKLKITFENITSDTKCYLETSNTVNVSHFMIKSKSLYEYALRKDFNKLKVTYFKDTEIKELEFDITFGQNLELV